MYLCTMGTLDVVHVLGQVRNLLIEIEVGSFQIRDLAHQHLDPVPGLLQLLQGAGVASALVAEGGRQVLDLKHDNNFDNMFWCLTSY